MQIGVMNHSAHDQLGEIEWVSSVFALPKATRLANGTYAFRRTGAIVQRLKSRIQQL